MAVQSSRLLVLVAFGAVLSGAYAVACGAEGEVKVSVGAPAPGSPGGEPAPPTGIDTVVIPPNAGEARPVEAPAGIGLPAAAAFSEPIKFEANRSSVKLYVPYVEGARDYRVFALVDGVKVDVGATGGEDVAGATITCAGLRQHNLCDDTEAITEYGRGDFYIPKCSADARAVNVPKTVVRQIEVNKLEGKTIVAVEAIDAQCPFPGIVGNAHVDVKVDEVNGPTRPATVNGRVVQLRLWPASFPIRTEADIRAQYKSLILNGQGYAPRPSDTSQSPFLNVAQAAPPNSPKVLRRAVVEVAPTGTDKLPTGFAANDVWDDFGDESDQPKLVKSQGPGGTKILPDNFEVSSPRLFQTSKWNIYSYGADPTQLFVAQGQLNMVLADTAQGIFSSQFLYPKRPMQLPADDGSFLHVTFEIQTNASQRRYWVFHACGAAAAGQTFKDGELPAASGIVLQPGFMNPTEGYQVSTKGWNCLQIVPRGGGYDLLEGGELKNPKFGKGRPETDLRLLVNRPTPSGTDPRFDTSSVILLGPPQYPGTDQTMEGAWYRSWDANKKINGVILDDQMFITQRTKFDVFLNRGRVVVYINGTQKICNDIPAAQRLTMAEAAVGIGQVLYHSNVEWEDFNREDWNRTAQYYYRHNTPFADTRSVDNVGMREGATLPASFQAGACYRK